MGKKKPSQDYLDALASDPSLGVFRGVALDVLLLIRNFGEICNPEVADVRAQLDKLGGSTMCANCGQDSGENKLFCSPFCRQLPELVRYLRNILADNRVEREDVQQAVGIRLLMLTAGGYDEQGRRLTAKQREEILQRDCRRCRICGAPATEIDHICGSSNEPSNLRAVCAACNRAEASKNVAEADPERAEQINRMYSEIASRVAAPIPLQVCDDQEHWNEWQRAIMNARRRRKT